MTDRSVFAAIVSSSDRPLIVAPIYGKKRSLATPTKVDSKRLRAEWTPELVESLLEIRYSAVSKYKFNACKTNKQKTAWWSWLTSRLNTRVDVQFEMKQVKNRFTALKAEYRSLVVAKEEIGNASGKIKYPAYWEALCEHMQVRN